MKDQIVQVAIYKESGCNLTQGEYSVSLVGVIGGLDFDEKGGESDYHLIKDCISEWLIAEDKEINHGIDQEFEVTVTMSERYEQQDFSFIKWFEVDSFKFTCNL